MVRMSKAFDFRILAERLKISVLPHVERLAKTSADVGLEWVKDSINLQDKVIFKFLVPMIDTAKPQIYMAIDHIASGVSTGPSGDQIDVKDDEGGEAASDTSQS